MYFEFGKLYFGNIANPWRCCLFSAADDWSTKSVFAFTVEMDNNVSSANDKYKRRIQERRAEDHLRIIMLLMQPLMQPIQRKGKHMFGYILEL